MANKVPNAVKARNKEKEKSSVSARESLVSLYTSAISIVCDPDLQAMTDSMSRIDKMHLDDKKISISTIRFLSANFSKLLYMLTSDFNDCSKYFYEAFKAELIIDSLSDEDRASFRSAMSLVENPVLGPHVILGVSSFNEKQMNNIITTAMHTFNDPAVSYHAGNVFTDDPEITVMLSCPVYLLRMFAYNDVFDQRVLRMLRRFNRVYGRTA